MFYSLYIIFVWHRYTAFLDKSQYGQIKKGKEYFLPFLVIIKYYCVMVISTRRFCSRPSGVALEAIGFAAP